MISTTPEGYARSAAVAEPATYGNNVRLSIDSKIQAAVEKALTDSATARHPIDDRGGDHGRPYRRRGGDGFAPDLRPEYFRPHHRGG